MKTARNWAAQSRKNASASGSKRHPAASGGKWCRPSTRLAIYSRDGFACVYCGKGAEAGNPLSLDHLHPVELGGGNEPENLVTCCLSCNSRKQDKSIRSWFASLRIDGVDTDLIARRIRNQTRRTLDRAEGRRLATLRRPAGR